MRIICFLQGLWWSLPGWLFGDFWIEGHRYVEVDQSDKNKRVLICDRCGKEDIGYY